MTPARPASFGLGTPPPLQLWLHAVLMLFAELVSRAVSTLQMVLVRLTRDWHTAPHDNLPRETTGIRAHEHILRDDRRCARYFVRIGRPDQVVRCADHCAAPQDEAVGRSTESRTSTRHNSTEALMLEFFARDWRLKFGMFVGRGFAAHAWVGGRVFAPCARFRTQ